MFTIIKKEKACMGGGEEAAQCSSIVLCVWVCFRIDPGGK